MATTHGCLEYRLVGGIDVDLILHVCMPQDIRSDIVHKQFVWPSVNYGNFNWELIYQKKWYKNKVISTIIHIGESTKHVVSTTVSLHRRQLCNFLKPSL